MNPEELKTALREVASEWKKHLDKVTETQVEYQRQVDAKVKETSDTLKSAVEDLNKKGGEISARQTELEQKLDLAIKATARQTEREKSVGQQIVVDPNFVKFAGRSTGEQQGKFRYGVKTITSITGSAGTGIREERLPGVIEEPLRRLLLRDLLNKGRTNSNAVEWVQELLFTNNARSVSEGALKPESNITYELKTIPVRTLAHWIRASKQVLADFPQLETLIDGRLSMGLKVVEENELLYGDGTGIHLLGLVPQATAYNTALNTAGDTMVDTVRHAILQVRLAQYAASGVVLSPVDWHYLELTKDSQGRYMIANATSRTPAMIWGLPVVDADGMSPGDFLVGAFNVAATILDREDAAVEVSTEDQDNFVRNLVTIRAEERLALAVTRPKSFVFGAFPAASTT
jgi:HK97 family phage major capsid protein